MADRPAAGLRRLALLVLLGFLLAHTTLVAFAATRHTPSMDEVGHFVAGLHLWSTGQFELYRVNPPLVRAVATFPVWCGGVEAPPFDGDALSSARPEFILGPKLLAAHASDFLWWFALARWACLPFTWLGAYICYRWARELYGGPAGFIALVLWCFSPNVLAHAAFITPDLGGAALGVTAGYAFWRWLKQPGWGRAAWAGAALGLAELAKSTWVVLFPLWAVLWLGYRLTSPRGPESAGGRAQARQLGLVLSLGLYLLNLGFGFDGTFRRLGTYRFISATFSGRRAAVHAPGEMANRFAGTALADLPVPLPEQYLRGIDYQKWDFERGMESYLRGEWRHGGWWYYYLYALAIKVPLGTWALLGLAGLLGLLRLPGAPWRDTLVLLAPPAVVLVLVSSQTGFNNHLRYALGCFPFAFVFLAGVGRAVGRRHVWLTTAAAGCLLWSVLSSLAVYPHSLSYFNELVGGPRGGHAHLLHSNIDWGQDLLHLRWWLEAHPEVRSLGLACPGSVDPQLVGINSFPAPPAGAAGHDPAGLGPPPGWMPSASAALRSPRGEYAYFLPLRPVGRAGYSIYIYRVGDP